MRSGEGAVLLACVGCRSGLIRATWCGQRVPGWSRARPNSAGRDSDVQKLVLQVFSGQSGEQSPHSCSQIPGWSPPSNDDARVGPIGPQPLSVQTLEVNPVMGKKHASGLGREGQLLEVRPAELPRIPCGDCLESPCPQDRGDYNRHILVEVDRGRCPRHPGAQPDASGRRGPHCGRCRPGSRPGGLHSSSTRQTPAQA